MEVKVSKIWNCTINKCLLLTYSVLYLSCHCTGTDDAFEYFRALLNLIPKESSNDVKFNYFCKYCPSKGGDVVQTDEGIVQFSWIPCPSNQSLVGKLLA